MLPFAEAPPARKLLFQRFAEAGFRAEGDGADGAALGRPVAGHFAVLEDDVPEGAGVVVGFVAVVGVEGDVAALVADQVFVVGGEQVDAAAAEAAGATVAAQIEVLALPALPDPFPGGQVQSPPAVADV